MQHSPTFGPARHTLIMCATAAGIVLAPACSRTGRPEITDTVSGTNEAETSAANQPEEFIAENDIGMTVRSMANTINIGENLDSTDYNFEGVLTDGIGMPLFTDMTGMPGEWEVEVVDSAEVRIRNLDAGDLQPFQLIEYITSNLGSESHKIEFESEIDSGDSHIVNYRYGRTSLRVETRPHPIGDTGEVAPIMEITLRADSITHTQSSYGHTPDH